MEQTSLLWSHLGILNKERYSAILEVYGSLDAAVKHVSPELLISLGCKQETVERVLGELDTFDQTKVEAALQKQGIIFIDIEDPRYPRMLKETSDPPIFLYIKGDLSIFNQPSIALVGTRQMSSYGRRVTQTFTEALAKSGLVTVSGLASGVDTIVAEETIKAKGKTIAVLGHGLDTIFPAENTKLADSIVANGGIVMTEEAMGVPGDAFRFPKRNRIVAGLTLGTVVLEAPIGSGALITARQALDEGRDVFIVPGQIFDTHYEGSHKMLASGAAKLVTKPEEVLSELGIHQREELAEPTLFDPTTDLERMVYNALTAMPQKVDDVVEKAKLKTPDVTSTLTMLELQGAAKNVGNGMWVRG